MNKDELDLMQVLLSPNLAIALIWVLLSFLTTINKKHLWPTYLQPEPKCDRRNVWERGRTVANH